MNSFKSPPKSPKPRLFVEIPCWEERSNEDGSKFTIYRVVVRCKGKKWILMKRYSDFDNLKENVKSAHRCIADFDFPKKSKFNTFSQWTKERRRTGFEDFMMLLLGFPVRPAQVDEFLEVDKHFDKSDFSENEICQKSPQNPPELHKNQTKDRTAEKSFETQPISDRKSDAELADELPNQPTPRFPPFAASSVTDSERISLPGKKSAKNEENMLSKDNFSNQKTLAGMAFAVFFGWVVHVVWHCGGSEGVLTLLLTLIVGLCVDRSG
mmetsp:Transcript_10521/g.15779  ORF Transcript_10521/g.15779 Transcript_10521/m.15779 type:complete len:267 (+) Transcript_10521:24-824(+)